MGSIRNKLIVLVSIVLDSILVYLFLVSAFDANPLASFLALHGLTSLVFATGMLSLLPEAYRQPKHYVIAFLSLLAFVIPFLGALGIATIVLYALEHPKLPEVNPWLTFEIPELPHKTLFEDGNPLIRFSEGGLAATLRFARDPEQRLHAVMALRQLPDQKAMPILRLALGDAVDDVRLLAYSMIDRKDQEINGRIQKNLRLLEKAESLEERFVLHRALGQDYWELAYLGVADGDVLNFTLFAARRNILTALELQEDVGVRFLLGRVALWQKELDLAEESFEAAVALGLPESTVLPYLAEVAYYQRRYQKVREILMRTPPRFLDRPPLNAVAEFWLNAR